MKTKKITINELRSLVKQIIKENYDEYGDKIDYSTNFRKNNFKPHHPEDDYFSPEDDDKDWQKEYDDEMDRQENHRKYFIVNEIKNIFNGEALDAKKYNLFYDDGEEREVLPSVGNVREYNHFMWMTVYVDDYGDFLDKEELENILKKELEPKYYKKLNIHYNLGVSRNNKTKIADISYYMYNVNL